MASSAATRDDAATGERALAHADAGSTLQAALAMRPACTPPSPNDAISVAASVAASGIAAAAAPGRPLPFSVRFAVGPMVGQSDHAFRMLTRAHGATVAYTPMLYANRFRDEEYRRQAIDFDAARCPSAAHDRPLIVQFAANDPAELLYAAQHVEHMCDAVDINLGCPQERARDGHYGSYLLSRRDWPLVERMVRTLHTHLSVPVMCKIRLLQRFGDTLEFCLMLQSAGCACIAVHGRQRGSSSRRRVGPADLDQIARLKRALAIPVISNGNIRTHADALANLEHTACDGVMSAEAVLANPRLFTAVTPPASCADLSEEYLSYCDLYSPPPLHWMSDHIANVWRGAISQHQLLDLRARLKLLGRGSAEAAVGSCSSFDSHSHRGDLPSGMAALRLLVRELDDRVRLAEASAATDAPYGHHLRHQARQARKNAAEQANHQAEDNSDDLQGLFD